ncbi:hypothetical protein [Siphonobacter sp. SORGH_AS_0500]|uniref:hypothetical protein n=1 Tax=Siphonobacter sp. SORGH_AS_0500 TaxID=1864824 RepID=UPI00286ADA7E|nr:hypothetical protein [Siphonobacter sp. SORGH_AS_0500]
MIRWFIASPAGVFTVSCLVGYASAASLAIGGMADRAVILSFLMVAELGYCSMKWIKKGDK